MDRVGGDEAEAFGFGIPHEFSRLLPPEHDEVGGFGDASFPCFAKGFCVAIAESFTHPRGSDKRRISHDVIRLRPFCALGIGVIEQRDGGGFVGDFLAGDGVELGGVSVPEGENFTGFRIAARDALVVSEHGILFEDALVLG